MRSQGEQTRVKTALLVLGMLLLGPLIPGVAAQGGPYPLADELMNFSVDLSSNLVLVSIGPSKQYPEVADFAVTITDTSLDQPGSVYGVFHTFQVDAYFKGNVTPNGWTVNPPQITPTYYRGGQTIQANNMQVLHSPSATVDFVEGLILVTMIRDNPPLIIQREYPWAVRFAPSPVADIQLAPGVPTVAHPNKFVSIPVNIYNLDYYPASYTLKASILPADGIDPADIAIVSTGSYYLNPGEVRTVEVGFQAPRAKTWYSGSSLIVTLSVEPNGGRGAPRTTFAAMTLQGFYISENLVLAITAFLIQLALIVLAIVWFVHWRAMNVYGKPIPPWKIPEEKAHLARLRQEDPRAHYIVRYFLMEEEYRSALLWYYSFKRVSKKQLKAEARVVALRERAQELEAPDLEVFDRAAGRLKKRYDRLHARLKDDVETRVAALQAKLDRSYERDYEQDHAKWEKRVARLEAKANRPLAKERKAWEKEKARLVAEWQKPFAKEKKVYDKALAAAKERYAKFVKKKDKPVYKAWREQMEDWQVESKLRKREKKEPLPEPELLSPLVPREGFPQPLKMPPPPDLPAEPKRHKVKDVPPEPELVKPKIEASHYARRVRRIRRRADARARRYKGELAIALEALDRRRSKAVERARQQREGYLEASSVATSPGVLDRLLRRTPEAQERRHRAAFIRGQTKERMQDLLDREEATVERVRGEALRREAELEAQIIRTRADARKAARLGSASAVPADVAALESKLKELRDEDQKRVAKAEKEAYGRIVSGTAELKALQATQLAELEGHKPAPSDAARKRSAKA